MLFTSAVIVVGGIGFALIFSSSHVTTQQRIANIESEVKCPSCDGISALDSNTAGAFAVRSFIEQAVKTGRSDSQIINSLEASYGPTILMSPPAAYGGRIIAVLPFVFVALVLGFIGFFGYRRRRRQANVEGSFDGHLPAGGYSRRGVVLADHGLIANEPTQAIEASDEPILEVIEPLADVMVETRRRLGSIRQSWALYLGILLLISGVGYGIWVMRGQSDSQKQLAAARVQAQNEAQTILRARVLANQGQDVQALQLLSSVLKVDPNQPVALAYQGWLLRQAGEKDNSPSLVGQGQQLLEKAVKLDPGYPDARVFLGYILLQDRHDVNGAIKQFAAFLADKPSASFLGATKSVIVSAYQQAGLPVPSQLS